MPTIRILPDSSAAPTRPSRIAAADTRGNGRPGKSSRAVVGSARSPSVTWRRAATKRVGCCVASPARVSPSDW